MVFGFEAVLDFFMAMFTEFTVKLKRSPSMMRLDIDFNRVLPGFTVFLPSLTELNRILPSLSSSFSGYR